MKKNILLAGIMALSTIGLSQTSDLVPQYPEELYQLNGSGSINGTARFQGLSGAMGALGGDLSATYVNPAGAAVFMQSEGALTAGVNSFKTEIGSMGADYDDSEFNLNQAGAVFLFDDLNSANFRNVAIAINYQRQNEINEVARLTPNITSTETGNILTNHYYERFGESSVTNFAVATNYQDRIYFGGALNFHTYEVSNFEAMVVDDAMFEDSYTYYKDATPNSRLANGISAGLGVIGKVNQQLRLGLAYQSPTWYVDTEEILRQYSMFTDVDDVGEYYYIDAEERAYLNDLTTNQKFTGSAAFVIGQNGLISADYTYTDYSPAKFKPDGVDNFDAENNFIDNEMSGTSTVRVGAEGRFNDFRVRGGFRYEQSPFEEYDIFGDGSAMYKPFGNLTGFSIGAGYEFKGFYVDAAYSAFQRDRSYLISGDYYDWTTFDDGAIRVIDAVDYTQDEALDFLSLNAEESGFGESIKDITEKQGNISLTLGFRF